MRYYVEYSQTIIFRAPIEAHSLKEAEEMFNDDRVNYDEEEIIDAADDFRLIDIYAE